MNHNTHLTELGHSPDALAQRQAELLALLRQTAPEVLSDNQLNVEKLKELLGQERMAPAEHYELNWAGKTAARREIQKTSSHTLRPSAMEQQVSFTHSPRQMVKHTIHQADAAGFIHLKLCKRWLLIIAFGLGLMGIICPL